MELTGNLLTMANLDPPRKQSTIKQFLLQELFRGDRGDFMARYADYAFYVTEFAGNIIPNEEFQRVIAKASAYIKNITFSRVDESNVPEEVKAAACAAAEIIYNIETSSTGSEEKKSETTDGYSVTYVNERMDGQTMEDLIQKKVREAAKVYLLPTGLLFRGVVP